MQYLGSNRKLSETTQDPLEFDELVVAWNALCERAWEGKDGIYEFTAVETAALARLADSADVANTGKIGNEISRKLSSFAYPTYMVGVYGRIAAANTAAILEFDVDVGESINQLPLFAGGAQSRFLHLSTKVRDRIIEAARFTVSLSLHFTAKRSAYGFRYFSFRYPGTGPRREFSIHPVRLLRSFSGVGECVGVNGF